MNAMANATKKLYEAFVPAGNLFSSQIIAPFTSGLEVLADGFNAFFAGQQAATKGGAELAAKLQDLRPTFEGLAANAKAVASRVIELSKAFLPLLELGARLLSSPLIILSPQYNFHEVHSHVTLLAYLMLQHSTIHYISNSFIQTICSIMHTNMYILA